MVDVAVPTAPTLSRVNRVDLAHTGRWAISSGSWNPSREDFVAAVAALDCPAVRRPVLKLGHSQGEQPLWAGNPTGAPAVGYVDNLGTSNHGHTLVGDFVGMPGWLGNIAASAYPDRSVEGTYDHRCQLGHTHPFVITAVALLGVTPPGVGTLRSLQDVGRLYGVEADAGGVPVAAHLPGQHDQSTHGRRFNLPGVPSSGLRPRRQSNDITPTTAPEPEPEPELPAGVTVTETRGRLHVQSPYDKALIAGLKDMGGRWLPKSRTWSVPAERDADLRTLLDRTFNQSPEPADTLPAAVTIRTRPNSKIEVGAPFNDDFRREARSLGGAWDPTAKRWVFPPHRESQVRVAAARHYGPEWQAAQRAAEEAKQQARAAERQARQQDPPQRRPAPMSSRQRNLLLQLINRHARDDMFWHDFFDGAGGPPGQYQPGGPSQAQIEEWLERASSRDASALIDDLIAWGRGY